MRRTMKLQHAASLALAILSGLFGASPELARAGEAEPVAAGRVDTAERVSRDAILGEWWTEGREGRVRFAGHEDGTFLGTTTCCKAATPSERNPDVDKHNPNPKLRNRSTIGIVIIWNLAYAGGGRYNSGYIYNPRDGDTYRLQVEVIDQRTLKIRGYLGVPLLGQTQIWKRMYQS